jgi:hypothetical protein
MEATHNINYEGIDFEIKGDYEIADETTGYKGGWSTELILINDVDIYWMLKPYAIQRINEIVIEQNY